MMREMRNEDLVPLIRQMRASAGLSMREVSERCGRSIMWYQRKESGERAVSMDDLDDIARATGHQVAVAVRPEGDQEAEPPELQRALSRLSQLDDEDRAFLLDLLETVEHIPDALKVGWVESGRHFKASAELLHQRRRDA